MTRRARAMKWDSQREYLEALLERLSSGVLTLDISRHIQTFNQAATEILGTSAEQMSGVSLDALVESFPYLEPLERALSPLLTETEGDWQEQVVLFAGSGRQVLMCRGTTLHNLQSDHRRLRRCVRRRYSVDSGPA